MVALIILFPILSFLILIFWGSRLKSNAPLIAIAGATASLALSIQASLEVLKGNILEISFPWLSFVSFNLRIDSLSSSMLLLVFGVGLLIAIYSIGYMKGDSRFPQFFAYFSLFLASMSGLVLCSNLILLYIFWELVGFCSYLLIGFWFEKHEASAAAKKAFIVTRIGDIGFLIGILLIFLKVGSVDFQTIFNSIPVLSNHFITVATLLLFCGAVGKSAQFPLHVWLPDAMEGPTPVSALIHAATMVTAGVYMVARFFPLFAQSPTTLLVIGSIGITTALLAGLIATTQNDIKKILAYSTISQLGFMMLAMGSMNPDAGMFHLLSHGIFKALLFLSAGSIIHAMHTNDINQMGGLFKSMPITSIAFLAGLLSLSGIPPFIGFFSKDAVMVSAYNHFPIGFMLALPAIFLTSFYMFRLFFKAFFGVGKSHESPLVMTVPLTILAAITIAAGCYFTFNNHMAEEMMVMAISLGFAIFGILCAWIIYGLKIVSTEKFKSSFVYKTIVAKFYLDELYSYIFSLPSLFISRTSSIFDKNIVDGIVNGFGLIVSFIGDRFRRVQTGLVQNYLLFAIIGLVIILAIKR